MTAEGIIKVEISDEATATIGLISIKLNMLTRFKDIPKETPELQNAIKTLEQSLAKDLTKLCGEIENER